MKADVFWAKRESGCAWRWQVARLPNAAKIHWGGVVVLPLLFHQWERTPFDRKISCFSRKQKEQELQAGTTTRVNRTDELIKQETKRIVALDVACKF